MGTWMPRAAAAAAGAVAVACVVLHLAVPSGAIGVWTYCGATLGAGLLAATALAVRRPAPGPAWAAIALGLCASGLGDVLGRGELVTHGPVAGSTWSDLLWLAGYAGIAIGLFRLGRTRAVLTTDGVLDLLTIAVVAATVVWHFALGPAIEVDTPLPIRLLRAAFPVLDLALVVLVGRLLVAFDRQRSSVILALGVSAYLAADAVYLVVEPSAGAVRFLDLGWMSGALLLALSAWSAGPEELEPTDHDGSHTSRARLAFSVASLLVPALIKAAQAEAAGGDPDRWVLFAATAALVAITYCRVLNGVRSADAAVDLLRARERHYEALAESSSDAVYVIDTDGRIRDHIPGLGALLGRDLPDTRGLDSVELIAPVDRDAARQAIDALVATPGAVTTDVVAVDDDLGRRRWMGVRLVNLLDDPDVAGLVVALHDATAQKEAEAQLEHQAYFDPLTGLANRTLFRHRVDATLELAAAVDSPGPAVILLDLDGFKAVNDTFGHDLGDVLLTEVGRRLGTVVRNADLVARLGGDEFAVLVDPDEHPDVLPLAQEVALRIVGALDDPVVLGGRRVAVTASIGIDVARPRADAGTMLRNGDIAMYRAKAEGKARTVVYDPGMRIDAVERFELENDAPHALDRGELRLVHQPVIDLDRGVVVGVEALLRWDHPDQGPVPPDRFIPVLEATGHIVRVGAWVLREALRTVAHWRTTVPGHGDVQMAVNVSGHQLADPDFVHCVRRELEAADVPPGALVLEITETALVADPETAAARLAELRDLGVILAMDDFGTGYSSLSYLRQFPVHILKVDRSFTATMPENDHMPALVTALLDLGRALDLEIVAEGIERPDQRDRLRAAGCHFGQGYLFSRPIEADAIPGLLMTGVPTAAAPPGALSTNW